MPVGTFLDAAAVRRRSAFMSSPWDSGVYLKPAASAEYVR